MAKKVFVLAAILITIVVIISIIISIINLKPATFKSIVSYDSDVTVLKEAPVTRTSNNSISNSTTFIENLLNHEKTVMFFSIIIITVFVIIFYGAKRSKS